ncbi:RNA-binding protein 33-like isoform X2 [Aethina tumida]|uniref:RNA-binding protein 33-like isoform X2 n=1 Tax=Aethina tumida TaxID=116153 RepID=UPI002148C716|nr:RNA-binding protein 33-like isoform X2 [Aethina tumida]
MSSHNNFGYFYDASDFEVYWTSIYVTNFPPRFNEAQLCRLFDECGTIKNVRIFKPTKPNARLYAFINFEKKAFAEHAVRTMNGLHMYEDKYLYVSRAQTRKMREDFIRKSVNMGLSLYIKNFDESIDELWFKSNFSKFGTITCIRLLTEQGRSKGVAFVSYSTEEAANEAIKAMNGFRINNRPLYISHAERKKDKSCQDTQGTTNYIVVPPTPAPLPPLMTPLLTENKDLYYQEYANGMAYFYKAEDLMNPHAPSPDMMQPHVVPPDMMQSQASPLMLQFLEPEVMQLPPQMVPPYTHMSLQSHEMMPFHMSPPMVQNVERQEEPRQTVTKILRRTPPQPTEMMSTSPQQPIQMPYQEFKEVPPQQPMQMSHQDFKKVPRQQPTQMLHQEFKEVPPQQPTQMPTQKPIQMPPQKPIQMPSQQPMQMSHQEFRKMPPQQPIQMPLQQPAQTLPQQPTQMPPQQPTQMPPQQPTQMPPQQPTQMPPQQPTQMPPQQPTQMPP